MWFQENLLEVFTMKKNQKKSKVSKAASTLAKDSSTMQEKKRASKVMNEARGADAE